MLPRVALRDSYKCEDSIMSNIAQVDFVENRNKSSIDLDVAIAEAREELVRIAFRRKELLRAIRNFTQAKGKYCQPT